MKSKYIINDIWIQCSKCTIFKNWSDFSTDKRNKYLHTSQCLHCRNEWKIQYRKTNLWKIKTNNYRILKRSNPDYKKKEYEYRKNIYVPKVREKLCNIARKYRTINKEKILSRKKEFEQHYFQIWKKVIYDKKIWKILDYQYKKWFLVQFQNDYKLYIWKQKLKPFILFPKIKLW